MTEIERKYLLTKLPLGLTSRAFNVYFIAQGYIGRVRLRESASSPREYRICVKFGKGLVRKEYEHEIPRWLFKILWPFTRGRRVLKTRFKVAEENLTWEIDLFDELNLVLAEVELPSADTDVTFPKWLKPYIIREVTFDDDYANIKLAR